MSSILDVLKLLTRIENILCVYRNDSLFSENLKFLVKIRIFVDSTFVLVFSVYEIKNSIKKIAETNGVVLLTFIVCYVIFIGCSNLSALLLGNYYSNNYAELVAVFNGIEKLCANDLIYKRIAKKQKRKCYIVLAVAVVAINIVSFFYIYDLRYTLYNYFRVFIIVLGPLFEYRFYIENIVYYILIDIFVTLIQYLNESISSMTDSLSSECDGIQNSDMGRIRSQIEMWGEISRLLEVACGHLYDCFGTQMSLTLYSQILFYITLLYQGMLYIKQQDVIWPMSSQDVILSLTLCISINILIFFGGQRFKNETNVLDLKLANLHILLRTIPGREADESARAARALARRLRAAPLRVRLHSALPVRAPLFVDMLAVVLNYTIVLLQFNHVI